MAMVRHQARRLNREAPGGVLGALAVAGQVTMAVGPPLGGLLIAVGGWRLTFLVNVPLAFLGSATVLAWLPADDQRIRVRRARQELDPPGLGLFAAALTALLLFLMSLASPRWWLLGVTAALLTALTARELRARTPPAAAGCGRCWWRGPPRSPRARPACCCSPAARRCGCCWRSASCSARRTA